MKKIYGLLLFAGLVILLAIWHAYDPGSLVYIKAQGNCVPPDIDASGNRWSHGAYVTVKIHSAFTVNERAKIEQAFRDWNATNIANCSGVIFEDFDVLDAQPPDHTDWHWVGFDPNEDGVPGITLIGFTHFAKTYLGGRIRQCYTGECLPYVL